MSSSGSKPQAAPWFRAARGQPWWQRIAFRLTLLVLLVSTLPPLMLGVLAMRSARVAQEREVRERNAAVADWGVDKVKSYLRDIGENMRLLIQLGDLQAMDLSKAQPLLSFFLSYMEDVKELRLMDARGQELIKLAENRLMTSEDLDNQASSEAFKTAVKGEDYFGPVRTSEFKEPFITVALPVQSLAENRVVAVLAAEINLKRLWDEMLSFKVGQSGYLYVVNAEGQLLAHPDFSLVLARRDVSQAGAVRRFLQNEDDHTPGGNLEYRNYQGVPVIGVQARIPGQGWGVIVEQPSAEAFGNVNRMKIETTLVLLNAMAVTLVLAFISTRNLTKPLAELAQGARLLGAGDFAHRIPVRSADEIGEVAEHFNAMATQLRGSFERLQSLLETSMITSSSLELEQVLTAALEQMDRLTGRGQSGLLLVEERVRSGAPISTTIRMRGAGPAVRKLDLLGDGFEHLWQVLLTGRALPIDDVAATADARERALWAGQGLGAIMLLPLLSKGEVLGALWMGRGSPGPFSSQEIALAQTLANHVAIAIDNARLYDALRRTSEELELRVEARTRELREANEELVRTERLALIGQLAGGVGHELRNPLGAIGNAVYYLRMRLKEIEDPKVQKHLGILDAEVRRSNKIVTDLMDFSRIKPPTRTPTELVAIVRDVLARQPEDSKIQRVVELDGPGQVEVDADQVQQVILNLIMNAIEAMPEGGTLTIRTPSAPDAVVCTISDTGIGIPPENLEKIFQPLFTTKARGIGLGLAVCRRLTEANGGSLKVESRVGVGSTFTLTFPFRGRGRRMPEKIRILIVDDDIGTAETLGDILEASGYAVELAADGPEALRRFGANPFDVVFLDIKMPGMDGVEVFRRMKRQGQVSAVMMTAYALPDLIAEAVREGVVAVLAKPLPVERVLHFLAALTPGRPILIVEDDAALAESLQDLLRSHGHSVTCAGSGAAALAEMRRQQPDVVLLDIKLPNSNGYEILQTIRAQYPSTAVIMMTGYGRELQGLVDKSLEAGAVECLDKPFDIAQALRAIANARVQRAAERLREPERNVQ